MNKNELQQLSGEKDVQKAAKKIYTITRNPVIVMLGGQGTLYYTSDDSALVPAEQVAVVDTIGAGDSHTAAFLAGIAANYGLWDACLLANKTAAKVVQHFGCEISAEL